MPLDVARAVFPITYSVVVCMQQIIPAASPNTPT
jgi:hypothetical protein